MQSREGDHSAHASATESEPSKAHGVGTPTIETKHFIVGHRSGDGRHNAPSQQSKLAGNGRQPNNPLALFTYQTLSSKDYARLLRSATSYQSRLGRLKTSVSRTSTNSAPKARAGRQPGESQVDEDAAGHRILAELEIKSARIAYHRVAPHFRKRLPGVNSSELTSQCIAFGSVLVSNPPTRLPEACG